MEKLQLHVFSIRVPEVSLAQCGAFSLPLLEPPLAGHSAGIFMPEVYVPDIRGITACHDITANRGDDFPV
jgi:hypothetical protein